jgi:tetratricopeptide (TPR) repeat protein
VQDPAKAQQQAIREALAQAQTQWNSGAHEPAIDLLQQALGAAERAVIATPGAATQANLSGIVRELSRMQLAQGRAAAVWDLTLRLEPLLRSDPDVWAIRANAAQRLGRHQDSVHAYMTALQTRPMEQRWLLGAAVSLAALGQAGSATEMTDKARAVGPISKDVTTYLRQMGVVVREP